MLAKYLLINKNKHVKLFSINSNSVQNNTLVDTVGGLVDEKLTTMPVVQDDYLLFTARDYFAFNISGLNLGTRENGFTIFMDYYATATANTAALISISKGQLDWNNRIFFFLNKTTTTFQNDLLGSYSNIKVGKYYSTMVQYTASELGVTSLIENRYTLRVCFNAVTHEYKVYFNDVLIQDCLYTPTNTDYTYLSNPNTTRFTGRIYTLDLYDGFVLP